MPDPWEPADYTKIDSVQVYFTSLIKTWVIGVVHLLAPYLFMKTKHSL